MMGKPQGWFWKSQSHVDTRSGSSVTQDIWPPGCQVDEQLLLLNPSFFLDFCLDRYHRCGNKGTILDLLCSVYISGRNSNCIFPGLFQNSVTWTYYSIKWTPPPSFITLIFFYNTNPIWMLVSPLMWSYLDYADFTSNCIDFICNFY